MLKNNHIIFGKAGEQLACQYLRQQGFIILHQNWRYAHWELDIIAMKNNILHFVEVKTRRSLAFGYPETSVTKKKFSFIKKAANVFLLKNPGWKQVQFDTLAITLLPGQAPEYLLFMDVYC